MIAKWEELQDKMPDYSYCIDMGLSKLQDYFSHAIQVLAYQLAICKWPFSLA
jgi:hypothetical protein